MYSKSVTLILFLLWGGTIVFSQQLVVEKLELLNEGTPVIGNDLRQYEKIEVALTGVDGFEVLNGSIQLGMEVLVQNDKSDTLIYGDDLLKGKELMLSDIPSLGFNFDLDQRFEANNTFFIKVRLWDKLKKNEVNKEAFVRVLKPEIPEYIQVDSKGFDINAVRLYNDTYRLFKFNKFRQNEKFYIEVHFAPLITKLKQGFTYASYIKNKETGEKVDIKEDFITIDKGQEFSMFDFNFVLVDEYLKPGNYEYVLSLKNESSDQYFNVSCDIELMEKEWLANNEDMGELELRLFLNGEETKSLSKLMIGDRIDLSINKINLKLDNDEMRYLIGGEIQILNSKKEIVKTTGNLFQQSTPVDAKTISFLNMNVVMPWDFEEKEDYTLKMIVWDRYSRKKAVKEFKLTSGKVKKKPYGADLSKGVSFKVNENIFSLNSVVVLRNNLKYFGNELNPGDYVEVLGGLFLKKKFNQEDHKNLKYITQFLDSDEKILEQNSEDIKKMVSGEAKINFQIPTSGLQIGKEYILRILILDEEKELQIDYKFKMII